MSRIPTAIVVPIALAALLISCGSGSQSGGNFEWQSPRPDGANPKWQFSEEKASLAYSIRQHLWDYEVQCIPDGFNYCAISIRRKKDHSLVCSMQGHVGTVFTRWRDIIYIAEYGMSLSGCDVVALDLLSGKELWRSQLFALGPIEHFGYTNSVNIENDGKRIIVSGDEAAGQYLEVLDLKTGARLSNKQFNRRY